MTNRSHCDCFQCSRYCQCSCHKELTEEDYQRKTMVVHKEVVKAFDHVFDLVHNKDGIMLGEINNLQLNEKGVISLMRFFEKRSYYPNNTGIVYDPIRGQVNDNQS